MSASDFAEGHAAPQEPSPAPGAAGMRRPSYIAVPRWVVYVTVSAAAAAAVAFVSFYAGRSTAKPRITLPEFISTTKCKITYSSLTGEPDSWMFVGYAPTRFSVMGDGTCDDAERIFGKRLH